MLLIITGIILSILIFVGLGFIKEKKSVKDMYGTPRNTENIVWKLNKRQIASITGLLIILFGCFTIVPANTVGVKYNPFAGGTQEGTVGEGFYLKTPFEKIYNLSTKVQEFRFENISIQTKDSQFVNSIIQVQARIDVEMANIYFSKHGNKKLEEIQTILSNTIQKQFEKVTTNYNVMEILGEKRNEIVDQTLVLVKEELIKDGILVERITLVDTDAGAEVEKAISDEAIAKKAVETAEYEKQKAEIEGEAKVIEAQKQKEANDLLSITLTDEILMKQFLEKWNGELPVVYGSDGNILDISSFMGE